MKKDTQWHEAKRTRCIESYSSKTKLKSVHDWRKRIAATDTTQAKIAQAVGIKPTRLSEYMRFISEPSDERFMSIERAIKEAEGNTAKL